MAVSTFAGLQTTLRGLLAQQRALDVTSHNVANAGTAGYSRQEAVLGASPALRIPAGAVQSGAGAQLGTGVDVLAYRRHRDQFLDLQFRGQAMRLGGLAAQVRGLETVEVAFAEPGENGIANQLQEFWSGWENLADAPENPAARQALVENARGLTTTIAALDSQLATPPRRPRPSTRRSPGPAAKSARSPAKSPSSAKRSAARSPPGRRRTTSTTAATC